MIKIRQQENKPQLERIQFNCDDIISPKLKEFGGMCEYLNKSNTTLFIGRPGSGKTSLLINFVKKFYRKQFHHFYVFMPYSSRQSIKNNIFDKNLPEDKLFEELNEDNIADVYNRIRASSDEGQRSLVIYDDVQKSLKNPRVLQSLKNMIANQRHLKLVNLIMLQNFFALDKSVREIVSNIVMFNLGKSQLTKIFNEVIETNKEKFDDIRRLVYKDAHDWIFINLNTQRIWNNEFDEILYLEDDSDDENE